VLGAMNTLLEFDKKTGPSQFSFTQKQDIELSTAELRRTGNTRTADHDWNPLLARKLRDLDGSAKIVLVPGDAQKVILLAKACLLLDRAAQSFVPDMNFESVWS